MSTFTERVYKVVAKIPKGKVATYGQVAQLAGNAKASRAVGAAMHGNKDTKSVPCHRVVSADGSLTGYAFGKGVATKRAMLQKEGIVFKGNKVDLVKSKWKK